MAGPPVENLRNDRPLSLSAGMPPAHARRKIIPKASHPPLPPPSPVHNAHGLTEAKTPKTTILARANKKYFIQIRAETEVAKCPQCSFMTQ
jgi:hypothetical protein